MAAIAAARPRAARGRRWAGAGPSVYFIALLLIGVMLAPVVYIIIGGFRTNSQITVDPAGWPNPWQFNNYLDVLRGGVFWNEVINSTITAGCTTAGVVALGLMTSFILARYRFRGRGAMYALFAAGLMFPLTVAITPLYIVVRTIGLMNTLPGVILPQIAFALPTTIIILVPFIRAIPDELQEAAAMLECTDRQFLPEAIVAKMEAEGGRGKLQARLTAIKQIVEEM